MKLFLDAFTLHYSDFQGRATRQEYWMFTLFMYLIMLAIAIIAGLLIRVFGLR